MLRVTPAELLPAASVWMMLMVCAPFAMSIVAVQLHVPSAATVALQIVAVPSLTVTVSPIAVVIAVIRAGAPTPPVPLNVGRKLLTTPPVAGPSTTGTLGGVVSTRKLRVTAGETVSAASV